MKSLKKVYKISIGFIICMLLGLFAVLVGNSVFARPTSINTPVISQGCNNPNGYKNWYENGHQGFDDCCGHQVQNAVPGDPCSGC